MKTILSTELKKGTRVVLDNGFEAILTDNRSKGNVRQMQVFGYSTDTGDEYVWKIKRAVIDDEEIVVELTDKQKENKRMCRAMGF